MSDSIEGGAQPLKLTETPEDALRRLQQKERRMSLNPFKSQAELDALRAEIARLGAQLGGE